MARFFPVSLVASYYAYSIIHYYMTLHLRDFRGASRGFEFVLAIFTFCALVFKYGFLVYFAYRTSWFAPLILFTIGFLLDTFVFRLEAAIRSRDFVFFTSLSGFLLLPVLGIVMLASIP